MLSDIGLQKPLDAEKYNIAVANTNSEIINSEIQKIKKKSQDSILATNEEISETDSEIITNVDIDSIFKNHTWLYMIQISL